MAVSLRSTESLFGTQDKQPAHLFTQKRRRLERKRAAEREHTTSAMAVVRLGNDTILASLSDIVSAEPYVFAAVL